MALARTSRGTWNSGETHGTGGFTTGSFTPSANSLLVVTCSIVTNGGSSDESGALTISDSAGLTWTAIANVGNGTSWSSGLRAWRAPVGASPSSMTVTVDCGANSIYVYQVAAHDWTGYDTSTPIGATATGGESGGTGLGQDGAVSITLSGAPASDSYCVGALACDFAADGANDITHGTGWTEIHDFLGPGNFEQHQTQERTGSTSTTVGWDDIRSAGTIAKSIALAFEVKAQSTLELEQEGFRWGDDDAAESSHAWLAAQDTNLTAPLDENVLLRLLINGTGDPASAAYTLRYQKNGSGGYVAVPIGAGDTVAPTVEAGDCTESGNNTATTSWDVSYPAYVSGDLLVFHVASDANVTHDWPATGPNGETVNTIVDSTGGSAQRASGFWFVGSATTSAGTLTVTPSASEQWTAAVLKVPAGEFNATTPIQTNVGTANDTGADTAWETPAWTSDATANGRVICFAAHDTVTTSATPAGWATLVARDRGACGLTLAARDAANTASESIASASFTKTSETDSSFGYVINGAVTTNEIYVATSANIAAGGEATTARLTAPSGKTTSDFVTGRRWDDENGTDSIDITADDYTEVEWCLRVQSPAETDDYYEFRVYAGSTALDTYTVTPKWTIGGGSITGTLATTESGADTAALAGDVLIDGSLAATESGGDTAALAGDVLIAGTFAATESGADVAAIQGTAQQVSTGSLAATESGADTASIAGTVLVDGALASTESGSDVAALIGVALVSGTLAATETGDDAAVIAGSVLAQGTLAATESGSDVAAIEGVTVNVATGALAATESGSDTAEIVGVVLAQGTLAANDSGEDAAAITGVALVSGTLDATEAGSDTAVIAAVALVQGSLDATESGSDTAAIEGSLAVISTGSLAATESGADTAEIAGVALVSGSLAATEAANDSAAMSGVVLITGTLDATESGQDTAAISSAPTVTTAYPGPAGKSRGKRRRVVIRERVYEVSERDIPALIEAELLDRAPPVTAEVVAGPKPPRKRRKSAPQPVKTVEQVREVVQQIKARIEPDNAWLLQALETVAFRVLERLQDEEDSLMLLLAA